LGQVGPPEEVYAKPVNLFVAQFSGSPVMNVAEVTVHSGMSGAQVTLAGVPFGFEFPAALIDQLQASGGAGKALSLGIRPQALDIALAPTPGYVEAEVHIVSNRLARTTSSTCSWVLRFCGRAQGPASCRDRKPAFFCVQTRRARIFLTLKPEIHWGSGSDGTYRT
jgi:ABC-type sugar transport system ATPase subunit